MDRDTAQIGSARRILEIELFESRSTETRLPLKRQLVRRLILHHGDRDQDQTRARSDQMIAHISSSPSSSKARNPIIEPSLPPSPISCSRLHYDTSLLVSYRTVDRGLTSALQTTETCITHPVVPVPPFVPALPQPLCTSSPISFTCPPRQCIDSVAAFALIWYLIFIRDSVG